MPAKNNAIHTIFPAPQYVDGAMICGFG